MADTDIIEVKGSNALVPNLTICVDNENDDNEPSQVEFQDKIEEVKKSDGPDVQFSMKSLPNHGQKVYENKVFATYGDLSPEAVQEKQRKRAQRFSSPLLRDQTIGDITPVAKSNNVIDEEDIKHFLNQIYAYNEKKSGDDKIRENALCVRGVQDMSTEEIFRYLNAVPAKHIEWINDFECNVIWSSNELTAKAFILYTKLKEEAPFEQTPKNVNDEKRNDDLMDIDEFNLADSDNEDTPVAEDKSKSEFKNSEMYENVFRKVYKNDKESSLEMKYTTFADKKVLGASKRSKYYMKHGNPNYGGIKGILSRSYKRKFHNRTARQEMNEMNVKTAETPKHKVPKYQSLFSRDDEETQAKKRREDELPVEPDNEEEKEDKSLIEARMKDLSDAISCEIEKSRQRAPITPSAGKGSSIWSRLGKKPSSAIVVAGPLEGKVTFDDRTKQVDVRKRLGRSDDRSRHYR